MLMKKINFPILILLLGISISLSAQTFGGGTGTSSDPYIISSVTHLLSMQTADYTNPLYFRMEADVDMTGQTWTQLNSTTKLIYFDGNGHLIKNLTINSTSNYASLFGILSGSCKNLGVINANITSTGSGSGIIAGYCGFKTPASAVQTGIIENCFTTGTVIGTDGIGGIAGNIGKPFNTNTAFSGIKNCYSNADVKSTSTTSSSRAGGIVGINYAGGILEKCYSTGNIVSMGSKAGGIAGWSDTDINGCVAMNASIVNKVTGNIGRISANMGMVNGIIAQGVNCWASEDIVLTNAEVSVSTYATGNITIANTPYDGETKTKIHLSDYTNFESILGWNFSSVNNIWAPTMNYVYPIFQWRYNSLITSLNNDSYKEVQLLINHKNVSLSSEKQIERIKVFNMLGNVVYNKKIVSRYDSFELSEPGVYILSTIINNQSINKKFTIN